MPAPGLDVEAPARVIAGSLRVLPARVPGAEKVDIGETFPSTCAIGLNEIGGVVQVVVVGDAMAHSDGCGVRGGSERAVVEDPAWW